MKLNKTVLRTPTDMRRLSVSALCKLSSLTIKWISLDHALFFYVLGKLNSVGQDEMRNSTCSGQSDSDAAAKFLKECCDALCDTEF